MVRWTTFPPDWPRWLSEQQCHLFGLLGLIGQVNININWLAGWHGWMTFNLLGWVTWSSHLGWQEILCHRWTLLSTGWLGWSASLLMIWSGEQLHLVGLSRAGWTSLSDVWSDGQQLYMVVQVCLGEHHYEWYGWLISSFAWLAWFAR